MTMKIRKALGLSRKTLFDTVRTMLKNNDGNIKFTVDEQCRGWLRDRGELVELEIELGKNEKNFINFNWLFNSKMEIVEITE